ncbi:MetS family NSS transporter small subunit [Kroppenstedtia pulmonis]|uniref:MetS family NSS transporter small subunit n=1 Tax=Kroppenstedtia pulmonis TaxID=1380685 RepID=A0A7D4BV57_9BACL|nr:MetS family NSS transporter small subunit [Kroppenstedtia pulmonis]QKG83713.1 MetS family NSS transporter small subunit [Kroppenstedtia pulmonis]
MDITAWIMFVIGAVCLWGGFAFFVWHAYQCSKQKKGV